MFPLPLLFPTFPADALVPPHPRNPVGWKPSGGRRCREKWSRLLLVRPFSPENIRCGSLRVLLLPEIAQSHLELDHVQQNQGGSASTKMICQEFPKASRGAALFSNSYDKTNVERLSTYS